MDAKKYFEKYNIIYGVSSVYNYGWNHTVYQFSDYNEALIWLHAETHKFAERELLSKSAVCKLAGKKAVENAISFRFSAY